jgi:hypothetical protein
MSSPPSACAASPTTRRAALRKIRAQQDGFRALRFDLRRDRARLSLVLAKVDCHRAALRTERRRSGGANARACARDEYAFTGQVFDLQFATPRETVNR